MSSNKLILQQAEELYRIPGYPDYAGTISGKIYSFKSRKDLQPRLDKESYARVVLYQNGKKKDMLLHRLVWAAVNQQDIPEGLEIDHLDRNRLNNNIDNLRLVTRDENIANSEKAKRPVVAISIEGFGEFVFPSTLAAAHDLGINQGNVSSICRGKSKTAYSSSLRMPFTFKFLDEEPRSTCLMDFKLLDQFRSNYDQETIL